MDSDTQRTCDHGNSNTQQTKLATEPIGESSLSLEWLIQSDIRYTGGTVNPKHLFEAPQLTMDNQYANSYR